RARHDGPRLSRGTRHRRSADSCRSLRSDRRARSRRSRRARSFRWRAAARSRDRRRAAARAASVPIAVIVFVPFRKKSLDTRNEAQNNYSKRYKKQWRRHMDLYFSPLACSMATRIALYEADAEAHFVEVDTKAKRTRAGADYWATTPLALVRVTRPDEGGLRTENEATRKSVPARYPAAPLAPPAGMDRSRLQQWLCFIGTELHKTLFVPRLDAKAPEVVKTYALEKGERAMAYLNDYLSGREYLLDRFSVAAASLF